MSTNPVPLPSPFRHLGEAPNAEALDAIFPMAAQQTAWELIEDTKTGHQVIICISSGDTERPRITSLIHVTGDGSTPIAAKAVRDLPLRAFELAFEEHRVGAVDRRTVLTAAGPDFIPTDPIGRPDGTDRFYARAALQYTNLLSKAGPGGTRDASPAQRFATLNAVPLSTAQRWLAEARSRGLLGPAKPGRPFGR